MSRSLSRLGSWIALSVGLAVIASCAAGRESAAAVARGGIMVTPIDTVGSRSFLVEGTGGAILVDAGMAGSEGRVFKALAARGLAKEDVKLILVTHAHIDHYACAAALRAATLAPVAAQRSEARFIEAGVSAPTVARNGLGRFLNALTAKSKAPACPVDILIDDSLDLSAFGVQGRVLRTPGHTSGSLSVFLDDGSAIVGDLLRGKAGKLGLGMFFEDEAEALRSVGLVAAMKPERVFLSHGAASVEGSDYLAFAAGRKE
jgi:hydroxyacylglutathione hydrolase